MDRPSAKKTLTVIVKTHNDYNVLDNCITSLQEQSYADFNIVIMDTASDDLSYVYKYSKDDQIDVLVDKRDLGFCVGNNIATAKVIDKSQYVMYLNPDAFLQKDFLSQAVDFMEQPRNSNVGILTGKLLWFDLNKDKRTNIIDSAGIFQTWYGKWYNRGMGEVDKGQYSTSPLGESVPAACGALMVCRSNALRSVEMKPGEYFNNSFYMYKDDIDLSFRVRNSGFDVIYQSEFIAWHCRGWQRKNRQSMPKKLRLYAAKNEIYINRQISFLKYSYSLAKLGLVKLGL